MKLSCDVIIDLLPGYIEKLTSAESNRLVGEHLENCPTCKVLVQKMQADAVVNPGVSADIKPLKKYRRRTLLVESIGSFIILSLLFILVILVFDPLGYRVMWLRSHSHQIEEIVATDCVTEVKFVIPFSYEEGAVQDDGVYYTKTYFQSGETINDLANRIEALKIPGCTVTYVSSGTILISYGESRFLLYQVEEEWYNWCFSGQSVKASINREFAAFQYIQFPLHLCDNSIQVTGMFNDLEGDLTSQATYQDFVDFYLDSGFYRFTATENVITLTGYADSDDNNFDDQGNLCNSWFPIQIIFTTDDDGVLTITFE